MNHTNLIFIAFSFIVGILVFAIWSSTHVFAQQSSSLPSSGGSGSNSPSNPISSELKAKMCDPSWTDILSRISYNFVAVIYITILINQKPCTIDANEILLMIRV